MHFTFSFILDETKLPGGSGTFRFLCPSTNCVLVSRTDKKPEIDGFELNSDLSPDHEEQHFRFLFEVMINSEIVYDTKSAKVVNENPSVIARQELENRGEVQQVQDLIWNEDITQEHSFEKSEGYEVGGEWGLKVSLVPELIETDVRVKTTTKQDWKTGEKNLETIKWGTNQHLAVPAGKTYIAQLTGTKGTVTMPVRVSEPSYQGASTNLVHQQQYTIKSTGKDSGAKSDIKGVYTGVQFYNIHTVVYDKEDRDASWVIEDTGKSNRELRSYEPQGGEQDSEEKETYENQGYYNSRTFEDATQQEEYPKEEEEIHRDSYNADDAEDTPSSHRYAEDESYNDDKQQKDYPEAEEEDEFNGQTESYDTVARQEYANARQGQDDQDPRFGQAFDDNRNEYEMPQSYRGSALDEDNNAIDQLNEIDDPVSEYREAEDQQTRTLYSENDDTGVSSTPNSQSRDFTEETSSNSEYQSHPREGDMLGEEKSSYIERNSDTYEQSSIYREGTYGERPVAQGYDYGANSDYGAYNGKMDEFINEGEGQRYDLPYRSYGD